MRFERTCSSLVSIVKERQGNEKGMVLEGEGVSVIITVVRVRDESEREEDDSDCECGDCVILLGPFCEEEKGAKRRVRC